MTQEEFAKKWRTKWLGYILDFAIADLRGGLLYARLKEVEREMTNDLNLMYRDAKEQPLNVTPKPLPPKSEPTSPGTGRQQANSAPTRGTGEATGGK